MLRLSSPTLRSAALALGVVLVGFSHEACAATKKGTSSAKSSETKPTAKKGEDSPSPTKKPTAKKRPVESDDDDTKTSESDEVRKKPKPDAAPDTGSKSAAADKPAHASSASLEPSDLLEFDAQPPRVQQLIAASLALTKLNLTYTYGSADPARGGMDCSGTIFHVLHEQGFAGVPRDSSEQYVWVRKAGGFQAVVSTSAESFEFDALRPGDLMFWTGTYSVQREIPVSHVMLYLGREKRTKQRVMFGASDGRSYGGVQRWGVSVFDFKMPKETGGATARVDFIGYGPIPGLRGASSEVARVEEPKTAPAVEKDTETKKPASSTSKPASTQAAGGTTKKKRKPSP